MKLKYDDDRHAYWLDGKRCKGASSAGKVLDDTYRLELRGKRLVAIGLAMKPSYLEAISANFDDADTLDEICDRAQQVAGSNDAADMGIAKHRIVERRDFGLDMMETDLSRLIVAEWQRILDEHELEVVPEYIERIVVHPGRRIAGRFDRIVRHKPTGKLRILDFKFGKWAVAYPHGVAVQLAIYGNAELMAGVIEGTGETTEFEPMPDVDKSIAYVFHMPEDVASLHEFDIEAGWAACTELLFPIYDWRARRDLVSAAEPTNEGDDMRRLQVRKRIERLTKEQRDAVAAQWPKGVPTLREDGHTQDQLDAIVDVLDRVCGFEVDSLDRDAPPDEGMTMTDEDIEAIRRYVKELPSDAALIFGMLGKQAFDAGTPVELAKVRSERRFEITRAALRLAAFTGDNFADDTTLELLTPFFDGHIPTTATPGAVLSAMTIDEARKLAAVLDSLIAGTTKATYDGGHLTIVPAA